MQFGTGVAMTTLKQSLKKTGTPAQNLNFRIETDNAGSPSGTLFHANATGAVTQASLSTSLADTTITLAGSVTIPLGTKVWVVGFHGTYGSETINNLNYYSVGVSSDHSSVRPLTIYDGTIHTNEGISVTPTWTGSVGGGTATSATTNLTANKVIKISSVTRSTTAWTTCTITQ